MKNPLHSVVPRDLSRLTGTALALLIAAAAHGQTQLQILHPFVPLTDGRAPTLPALAPDGTFYSYVTEMGGTNGRAIIQINTNGAVAIVYNSTTNSDFNGPPLLVPRPDGNVY